MLNELRHLGKELEKEIVALKQFSVIKSGQLDETRKKMYKEIEENQIMRNNLDKKMEELVVTKKELECNVKANEMLQEENKKCRGIISKLRTENEFYARERQAIKDKCHANDIEISCLKSQIGDLEEELQELLFYKELHEQCQLQNKNLIDQILSELDVLTKEQSQLENSLKESLAFTTRLSEERNLQSLFVKEANISRVILETEMLRLIGILEEERFMKRTCLESSDEKEPKENYLEDWKSSQEDISKEMRFLMEQNRRLLSEVEELKIQLYEQTEKNLYQDTY